MMDRPQLILASASPRRRELLSRLGVDFSVHPADIDETTPATIVQAADVAESLAHDKALAVAGRYPADIVLAADTIVVVDDRLLGKPESPDEAAAMLRGLRARQHRVITGVTIVQGRDVRVDHAVTRVLMRDYSDEEIDAYIASGQPFDKAGGYAIQDAIFRPVASYDGCYCNVVGLPLACVMRLLTRNGSVQDGFEHVELLPECSTCPLFDTEAPG